MSHTGLKVAGQAVLVVAGVAYGLHKGYSTGPSRDCVETGTTPDLGAPGGTSPLKPSQEDPRLSLTARVEALESAFERTSRASVSEEQLNEAMDRVTARLECELDRRFEIQSLSLAALCGMISQTDQMLEQVLRHLESAAEDSSFTGLAG